MAEQQAVEPRRRVVVMLPESLDRAIEHEAVEVGSKQMVIELACRFYFKLHEKEIVA